MKNLINILNEKHGKQEWKFHGTTSVKYATDIAEDEVTGTFHVTDELEVAKAYAGANGAIVIVGGNTEKFGVRSQIVLNNDVRVAGKNQWVMNAEEANEMINEAGEFVFVMKMNMAVNFS